MTRLLALCEIIAHVRHVNVKYLQQQRLTRTNLRKVENLIKLNSQQYIQKTQLFKENLKLLQVLIQKKFKQIKQITNILLTLTR